ncbi:leucine-rich repeat neuronal protein 2-like [Liolophura sinensis]|uniref:leucine-rich repeat neuronal protein 2-like n=1 Tax=Liolophura sinensis TaxID=3198878 RepID=UPI0031598847
MEGPSKWAWLLKVASLILISGIGRTVALWDCRGNVTYVECRGKNLSTLPNTDDLVTHLDTSQNNLQKIESLQYPELVFLNMSNNLIYHIHNDAFEGMGNLKTLDLSFNALSGSNFTEDTFANLVALEALYLQGNPISAIRVRTLDSQAMPKLKLLDLSFCGLVQLSGFADSDIQYLDFLSLRGNRLTEADIDVFQGVSFLEKLDMRDNPIHRINKQPFYHLFHLRELLLDSCQISTLGEDAFVGLDNLQVLSLRNNSLSELHWKSLLPLDKLQELILSENPIKIIDTNFVLNVKHINWMVQTLRMDNMPYLNSIGQDAFSNLQELSVISLVNNSLLTSISASAFRIPYGSLKTIYLTNSGLSTLPSDAMDWDNLQWVDMRGNPWYCDCKFRWIFYVKGITNKTSPIICQGPAEYYGAELLRLSPGSLGCVNRAAKVALGILLIACICMALGFGVYFILQWRRKSRYTMKDVMCCACVRKKDERYISVYQNDDFEPFARITFTDEDDRSKTAVDV